MSGEEFKPQDACGCCEGVSIKAPAVLYNRPGLSAIAYRIGTHSEVLASLQARLSSRDYPALAKLRTRDSDDFSIALLDAYACMADVLTFYQERLANEAFLRTAGERLSLSELARLIGYRLRPGVAAETWLAFTLQEPPPQPPSTDPKQATGVPETITLDTGLKVQSIPGPDEKPQTFETIERIEARPAWNAIGVQIDMPWQPGPGDKDLYLAGTSHQLKPGDVILIVGQDRRDNSGSERWDARMLIAVEVDSINNLTRIIWSRGLGQSLTHTKPDDTNVVVYIFRQQAALFGHNAPDPHFFSTSSSPGLANIIDFTDYSWKDFNIKNDQIDLDASYSKIVPGSWILLVSNEKFNDDNLPGYVEIYRANKVSFLSRTAFGLSTKITRIDPDTNEHLGHFKLQDTLVFSQSEQLPIARRPLNYPLYGDRLDLASIIEGLSPGKTITVSGKLARIGIQVDNLVLQFDDSSKNRTMRRGDSLQLAAAPSKHIGSTLSPLDPIQFGEVLAKEPTTKWRLVLLDRDGSQGYLDANADEFMLQNANEGDATESEIAFIADDPEAIKPDRDRNIIKLANKLSHVYDRTTVRMNANVALATHGETVNETLGSGAARQSHQRFTLRHIPLTYVGAVNETGAEAALEVRVNAIRWHETPTLYNAGANDRSYVLRVGEDGAGTLQFGDGRHGARLPTGQENLRAIYRKGIGATGNLKAGQLSQLLTRPLGLKAVSNPLPAEGGVDADSADHARRNMPLGVRTLGRVVSVLDYEDYARAYTGIAKAQATVLNTRAGQTVFISVAGDKGVQPPDSTLIKLLNTLKQNGDPLVHCEIKAYNEAAFHLALRIKRAPDYDGKKVLAGVEAALRSAFSFDARDFGQSVSRSEIIAVAQEVDGVLGVDLDSFYRGTAVKLEKRLTPAAATVDALGNVHAAELLLLDTGPLDSLEEMP